MVRQYPPLVSEPWWMDDARRSARRLGAATRGRGAASHSVYVILLHNPESARPWGLYVGQTARDPDWRFDQHKMGYKASRAVKRFGVRRLPELTAHLNPMHGWEAVDLEAALADALRAAGVPWVEGGH